MSLGAAYMECVTVVQRERATKETENGRPFITKWWEPVHLRKVQVGNLMVWDIVAWLGTSFYSDSQNLVVVERAMELARERGVPFMLEPSPGDAECI